MWAGLVGTQIENGNNLGNWKNWNWTVYAWRYWGFGGQTLAEVNNRVGGII